MAKSLVDSNILIYAYDASSEFHPWAKTWLERESFEKSLCISWQNLLEFYSVVTSSKRAKNPLGPEIAKKIIGNFTASFEIISPNRKSEEIFLQYLSKLSVSGPQVFDLYLAATALGSGVETIYTVNTKDFSEIPEIKAVNPL